MAHAIEKQKQKVVQYVKRDINFLHTVLKRGNKCCNLHSDLSFKWHSCIDGSNASKEIVRKATNCKDIALATPTRMTARNLNHRKSMGVCKLYCFGGFGSPIQVDEFWRNAQWTKKTWKSL